MYQSLILLLVLTSACGQTPSSRLSVDLPSRYSIGLPQDLTINLSEHNRIKLTNDLAYQRRVAWSLWNQLLTPVAIERSLQIYRFQSWYSFSDIDRLFSYLYGKLTSNQRKNRKPFTLAQIQQAEVWHIQSLFEHNHWNDQSYQRWIDRLDTEDKVVGMAGMDRILMNSTAAIHLLRHYKEIEECSIQSEDCIPSFPLKSAFIKTRWFWEGKSFPRFQIEDETLENILSQKSWEAISKNSDIDQRDQLIRRESYQGDYYSLAAAHLSIKTSDDWFWSTLWSEENPGQGFSSDAPEEFSLSYSMCSVAHYPEQGVEVNDLSPEVEALYRQINITMGDYSWCSNPYLEHGEGNQRTNCLGCHQHAGSKLRGQDLQSLLIHSPSQLRQKQRQAFPSDYAWIINFGDDSLQKTIKATIDYYDIYHKGN